MGSVVLVACWNAIPLKISYHFSYQQKSNELRLKFATSRNGLNILLLKLERFYAEQQAIISKHLTVYILQKLLTPSFVVDS